MANNYKRGVRSRSMIPKHYITEWSQFAPWPEDQQVEQDLIISRGLVDIFSDPLLKENLAFRGGTAIYKLYIPAVRYSEDIDLVQVKPGGIGPTIDTLRTRLDDWLGEPKRKFNKGRATLLYRFQVGGTSITSKIKIEINTREHFSVLDFVEKPFEINSKWFTGKVNIKTYKFNELIATKLRALYSRKKGRDLFDLEQALGHEDFNIKEMMSIFQHYMDFEDRKVSRAEFEKNLFLKLKSQIFTKDMNALLALDKKWDIHNAHKLIEEKIFPYLEGEPWKGME